MRVPASTMAEEQAMDTTDLVVAPEGDLHAVVMSRFKNSTAPEHRHLCAVVTAMAEVINEQGVPSNPTAYFAATMSALTRQWENIESHDYDDNVTTALCTFLAITLPKTSPAVIASKSSPGLTLLVNTIGSGKLSPGGLKPAFSCIVSFFQVSDASDWLSIAPAFNILLGHCLDQRPKVRKRAHECAADVLRGLQDSASLTMGSESVVSLFERSFLAISKSQQNSLDNKSSGNVQALQILYLLNALKLILRWLSGKAIGRILTYFKRLLDLEQPALSRQIFNTLQPLFTDLNADIPVMPLSNLLERIALMILEEKKAGDESMVAARIVVKGMEGLHSLDSQASALKLPLVFQSLAGMLAFEQEEAVFAAADSLKTLIQTCLDDSVIQRGIAACQARDNSLKLAPSPIERICVTTSSLLGYQFSPAWDVCLQVVACLFDNLGDASFLLMGSCVQALGDLEGLSDENLQCRRQLHRTIGTAVAAMGPEKFLDLLPLNLNGAEFSNSRLWLLPILRQNVVGANLGFFTDKILPIIHMLQSEMKKLSAEEKSVAVKRTQGVVHALWALFPAFCRLPSDTAESFGRIAKHVGSTLSEEPDLRGALCHGLQMLIKQNKAALGEIVNTRGNAVELAGEAFINKVAEDKAKALYTDSTARANIASVASFSRNFLPLLFNLFMAAPPEKRGVLQVTIGDIASISQRKVVKDFFVSIMQKLLKATKAASDCTPSKGVDPMEISISGKEDNASTKRAIFMDLALSLLQGLDNESVGVLFTAIRPSFQDSDGSVQKKGYKVLAGLCKEHMGFLAGKSNDVLEVMLISMPSCHFSARRHRLNCLHPLILHVFRSKNADAENILSSFIGEIVLATKETNIKTRNTAYEILVQLGHSLKEDDPQGSDGKLFQFFTMIVGCLAGRTPHMQSAAITGLARLIYEFRDLCQTIPDLLPSILLLLQTKSREVIKSVLGFLKVVVARQPAELLQEHIKSIVEGLLLWSDDSKNHFKAKVRVLLEMLVRRCGFQAVSAVMPEQHTKLLCHIRKMKDRKQRKEDDDIKSTKSLATTTRQSKWHHTQFFSDDDEPGSDEDKIDHTLISGTRSRATTSRSNRRQRKAAKMFPEDASNGEIEPLDLLDVQKTRSSLSNNRFKRKSTDGEDFEVGSDGRLIVLDEVSRRGNKKHAEDQDAGSKSQKSGTHSGRLKPKVQAKKKRRTETGWAYTGQEYASKKGLQSGDVKKQGKLDPYAYWPLDPKMLNRREGKKAIARKGLSSVVKATDKFKGMSVSEALGVKQSFGKGLKRSKVKQKFHKSKSKGRRK